MINRIDRVSVTHTQDTPRISVDIDHLGSRAWLETFTFFTDIAQSLPAIVLFLGLQLCMPSMYCTSPSYLPLSTFPSPPSFFLFLSFSFSFFPVALSTLSFPITIIFYLFNAHQNFNPKSCYDLGKIPKKLWTYNMMIHHHLIPFVSWMVQIRHCTNNFQFFRLIIFWYVAFNGGSWDPSASIATCCRYFWIKSTVNSYFMIKDTGD